MEQIIRQENETKRGQIIVGVVENAQGQILLIKRKDLGVYAFPSGKGATTKFENTPEEALPNEIRFDTKLEIEEESARRILVKPILGNKEVDATIAFVCRVIEGQTVKLNERSATAYAWVDLNDPRLEELPFDQPKVLEEYKKWKAQNRIK